MPFGSALSALIRFGAAAELEFGVETLSIGAAEPSGDYAWIAAGNHLCYSVTIRGEQVFIGASLVDSISPPATLLRIQDSEYGWRLAYCFLGSLEKFEVRSLEKPIIVGDPVLNEPSECFIVA